MLLIKSMSSFCEIVLIWMSHNTTGDKSALVQAGGVVHVLLDNKSLPEPMLT